MRRLSYDDFLDQRESFDEAVSGTGEISPFCSSSLWQVAAHDAMGSDGEAGRDWIFENGGDWIVFVEREQTSVFFPLESAWMFGCPLAGDPGRSLALLETTARKQIAGPVGFCIGGIRDGATLHRLLQDRGPSWTRLQVFPATDCMEIDLEGDFDAWLRRRSKSFRRSIRQMRAPEDLEIVDAGDLPARELFDRVLAIQRRTYKWEEGTDIFQGERYLRFYRILLTELHDLGELRLLFARRDGEDLAYIFGGVRGDTYRGLQMSFVEEAREWRLGNRLQLENLRARAGEGIVHYDLGMHAPYKERWADRRVGYVGAFVVP